MSDTNQFEQAPGETLKKVGEASGEAMSMGAKEWGDAMTGETGIPVPEFAGPKFLGGTGEAVNPISKIEKAVEMGNKISETLGNANEENKFYGEAKDEESERFDEGMENAQSLSGALADAVSKYGIEDTIQKLNSCDLSGSNNPIGDLYYYLGLGTAYESEETAKHEVSSGDATREAEKPASQNQDVEGTLAAIADMKELISEVQGASPVYEELRQGARAAGMGYFEFAVSNYGVQGLPELFEVLKAQKEQMNEAKEETEKEAEKQTDAEEGLWVNSSAQMNNGERLNPEITRKNAA